MPIITDIEEGIASDILTMRTSGGYNFDHKSVNEENQTITTYPTHNVYLESEVQTVGIDANWAGAFHNRATIRIDSYACATHNETTKPFWQIDKELNLVLDDLKRKFGSGAIASLPQCPFMLVEMVREINEGSGAVRPKYMTTRWQIDYTQDRTDPTQTGD